MIYYIAYYGSPKCKETRAYSLAAANKIDYIIQTLAKKFPIKVVSASQSLDLKSKGYTLQTVQGVDVEFLSSLGKGKFLRRVFDWILIRTQLLKKLLFSIRKNDYIVVYHSLGFMKTIALAKKIKKFKLILEVEEVYGDVIGKDKIVKREYEYFKKADAYIFPTKLLDDKINIASKPSILIHGTYQVESDRNVRFHDGKIHVVYAGTFDPRKGGAIAAVAAGEFLPENYHIHIIGKGFGENKKILLDGIAEVSKKSRCMVTYDGLKNGEDYIRFIQSCDIGLSTQNPDAAFNATSFPSKILSYMANGLRVVSIRIPAIEKSGIGKYVYYYDKQTPKDIAQAILKINFNDSYDSRKIISELSRKFTEELDEFFAQL